MWVPPTPLLTIIALSIGMHVLVCGVWLVRTPATFHDAPPTVRPGSRILQVGRVIANDRVYVCMYLHGSAPAYIPTFIVTAALHRRHGDPPIQKPLTVLLPLIVLLVSLSLSRKCLLSSATQVRHQRGGSADTFFFCDTGRPRPSPLEGCC